MMTTKFFEVTYLVNELAHDEELQVMDVPGYSHIKYQGRRTFYGGAHSYVTDTAFIQATSLTALRKALRQTFGYRYEKFLYHRITEFKSHR